MGQWDTYESRSQQQGYELQIYKDLLQISYGVRRRRRLRWEDLKDVQKYSEHHKVSNLEWILQERTAHLFDATTPDESLQTAQSQLWYLLN